MPHGKLVIPEVFKQDVQQQKAGKDRGKASTNEELLALLPSPLSSNVTPVGTPQGVSLDGPIVRHSSKSRVQVVHSARSSCGGTPEVSTPLQQHLDLLNVRSVTSSHVDSESPPPSPPCGSPPSQPVTPRRNQETSMHCSSIGDGESVEDDDAPQQERPKRRRHSTVVVSCFKEYTEVALMTEEGGLLCKEDVGMRRLPSVTGVLQTDTEDDLLDPIRSITHDFNESDVLVTACSSIKSDMLDGMCDRMKFARFKRSVSAASKGDFIVMTNDEELRSVWCAVLKFVPEADAVLYLGKTVFGVAGLTYEMCREFKGPESLLHHISTCDVEPQEGLLVIVEPMASMLHREGLAFDEPYFIEDIEEAVAALDEPFSAFLRTALKKVANEDTFVQINSQASWSVGAFVSHHEEPPPPPPE